MAGKVSAWPPLARVAAGYGWSVTAVAGFFAGVTILPAAAMATSAIGPARLQHLLEFLSLMALMTAAFWLATAALAIMPFALVVWFAWSRRIGSWLYYLAAGALSGVAVSPVVAAGVWSQGWLTPVPLLRDWLIVLPWLVAGGLIGGAVFWWTAGRSLVRPAAPCR